MTEKMIQNLDAAHDSGSSNLAYTNQSIHKLLWLTTTDEEKKWLLVVIFFTTVVGGIELVGVISLFSFLELIPSVLKNEIPSKYNSIQSIFGFKSPAGFLGAVALSVVAVTILRSIILVMNQWLSHKCFFNIHHRISLKLYEKYLSQISFTRETHSAAQIKNIIAEAGSVSSVLALIIEIVAMLVISSILVIGTVYIKGFQSAGHILILSGIYISIYLVLKPIVKKIGKTQVTNTSRRYTELSEGLSFKQEIQFSNKIRFYLDTADEIFTEFFDNRMRQIFIKLLPKNVVEPIIITSVVCILMLSIQNPEEFEGVLASLTLFAIIVFRLFPRIDGLNQKLLQYGITIHRLRIIQSDLLATEADLGGLEPEIFNLKSGLTLKSVSLSLPNESMQILTDVSFSVKSGQKVAIIGKSGSGKTSLLNLLVGLTKPSSGEFYFCGVNVTEAPKLATKQIIAYVSQKISLAHSSVEKNITFGTNTTEIDHKKLQKVIEVVGLEPFLDEMVSGLETNVGQDGNHLSGGLKQRVALARALYMERPYLFLDEATSALDENSEKQIIQNIFVSYPDITIFFISHRQTVLEIFDVVLKIQDRSVVPTSSTNKVTNQISTHR